MSGRIILGLAVAFVAFAAGPVGTAWAQDPVKVAPDIYTLVFENERVRVCDINFEPGEKIEPHSHPDHFLYILSAGTLKISKPDGTTSDFTGTPGQVVWIPAEKHWAENVGKTPVHALVVELKEPAPKHAPKPDTKPDADTKK